MAGCSVVYEETEGAFMDFIWWLLIALAWIVFLFLTMSIARSKGHSALLWGLLAVFLPLITVIIVLLLPNKSLDERPAL